MAVMSIKFYVISRYWVSSLFRSVFRWDYRWVLNSDWDWRSANKWSRFFAWPQRSFSDQSSDWAIAESKVNLTHWMILHAGDRSTFLYYKSKQTNTAVSAGDQWIINPLDSKGNYSATLNNTKLVHWPLMGGLLHLVQRGGAWAGCNPAQSTPRCTKSNSPSINSQCTNHCIAMWWSVALWY